MIHLAHRQHHLRRNIHKIWGNARCKHNICVAWAFTRRANGVTQDGAKVAGWTFLRGQKERRLKSGDRVFTEDLRLARSLSRAYVAAFAVVRPVSLFTRALSTGAGAVLKQEREKCPVFVYHQAWCVRCSMHFRAGHQCVWIFTSQMVQMLHKEPGRNADSSSPGNILQLGSFEFRIETWIQH